MESLDYVICEKFVCNFVLEGHTNTMEERELVFADYLTIPIIQVQHILPNHVLLQSVQCFYEVILSVYFGQIDEEDFSFFF